MVHRKNNCRSFLKSCSRFLQIRAVSLLFASAWCGCSSAQVKPDALDLSLLDNHALLRQSVTQAHEPEFIVQPSTVLMHAAAPADAMTFVGYRLHNGQTIFCLVLDSSPDTDRLVLLPLHEGENPLDVLADSSRKSILAETAQSWRGGRATAKQLDNILVLSLSRTLTDGNIDSPLPRPGRILAAAANFPSHLVNDLALTDPDLPAMLASARARVFQKYPPVPPPGFEADPHYSPQGIIGPYDAIEYPAQIMVPVPDANTLWQSVESRLDYEVEIGAVIGKRVSQEQAATADDEQLRAAVAGYVLVSDAKVRNPQVVQKINSIDKPFPPDSIPYLLGNKDFDNALGPWDTETCAWWSYAAGWGNYAALGPFFVAAMPDEILPARILMSARSYGPADTRPYPPPEGLDPDTFFLRQLSLTTEDSYHDSLVWDIPALIRSVLAPDSVLPVDALNPGDIICLGTPGGTVITSKPPALVEFAEDLLFWKEPLEWHDTFFSGSTADYLHEGDELLLWGENLGLQRHLIQYLPEPD